MHRAIEDQAGLGKYLMEMVRFELGMHAAAGWVVNKTYALDEEYFYD